MRIAIRIVLALLTMTVLWTRVQDFRAAGAPFAAAGKPLSASCPAPARP